MRNWQEERAELLKHADELRDRARNDEQARVRLELAANTLLATIQLADDALEYSTTDAQPAELQTKRRPGRPRLYPFKPAATLTLQKVIGGQPTCPVCHTNENVHRVAGHKDLWGCFAHDPPETWKG